MEAPSQISNHPHAHSPFPRLPFHNYYSFSNSSNSNCRCNRCSRCRRRTWVSSIPPSLCRSRLHHDFRLDRLRRRTRRMDSWPSSLPSSSNLRISDCSKKIYSLDSPICNPLPRSRPLLLVTLSSNPSLLDIVESHRSNRKEDHSEDKVEWVISRRVESASPVPSQRIRPPLDCLEGTDDVTPSRQTLPSPPLRPLSPPPRQCTIKLLLRR